MSLPRIEYAVAANGYLFCKVAYRGLDSSGLILTVQRTGLPALSADRWHRSSAAWLPGPITTPAAIAFRLPG
jgi:hypothetical protein